MSSRFGLWLDTDDVFAKNRVGSSTVAYTYRNLVDNGAISCKQLTGRDSESLGSVNLWRSDREIFRSGFTAGIDVESHKCLFAATLSDQGL